VPNVKCQKTYTSIVLINDKKGERIGGDQQKNSVIRGTNIVMAIYSDGDLQ
jgi:hypothetical protein